MYIFFHILQVNSDSDQGSHCDAVCLYGPILDVCYNGSHYDAVIIAYIRNRPIQTTCFLYLAVSFFISKC